MGLTADRNPEVARKEGREAGSQLGCSLLQGNAIAGTVMGLNEIRGVSND